MAIPTSGPIDINTIITNNQNSGATDDLASMGSNILKLNRNTNISLSDFYHNYNNAISSNIAISMNVSLNYNRLPILYDGTKFVVAQGLGTIGVYNSSDGINWNAINITQTNSTNLNSGRLECAAYGNGTYVFAPVVTGNQNGYPPQIFVSTNGINWTGYPGPITYSYYGFYCFNVIRFLNGKFYGAGRMTAPYYSTDGINWTQGSTSFNSILSDIAYGNGIYIAVNLGVISGTNIVSTNQYLRSTDGINWSTYTLPNNTTNPSCVFGNGRFVVFDGSVTYVSTDGINWTSATLPSYINNGGLYQISFGNGVFSVFSSYSVDGLNWNQINGEVSAFNILNSVGYITYGNGKFVSINNNPNANNIITYS